jgi:hypothetical protein
LAPTTFAKTASDSIQVPEKPDLGTEAEVTPMDALVLQQIDDLASLQDGWDSYGGSRPTEGARTRAKVLMATLYTRLGRGVPRPTVGPSADGGVVLRWRGPQYDVMLTVLADGGEYSVVDRRSDKVVSEGEIGFPDALVRDVIKPNILAA